MDLLQVLTPAERLLLIATDPAKLDALGKEARNLMLSTLDGQRSELITMAIVEPEIDEDKEYARASCDIDHGANESHQSLFKQGSHATAGVDEREAKTSDEVQKEDLEEEQTTDGSDDEGDDDGDNESENADSLSPDEFRSARTQNKELRAKVKRLEEQLKKREAFSAARIKTLIEEQAHTRDGNMSAHSEALDEQDFRKTVASAQREKSQVALTNARDLIPLFGDGLFAACNAVGRGQGFATHVRDQLLKVAGSAAVQQSMQQLDETGDLSAFTDPKSTLLIGMIGAMVGSVAHATETRGQTQASDPHNCAKFRQYQDRKRAAAAVGAPSNFWIRR